MSKSYKQINAKNKKYVRSACYLKIIILNKKYTHLVYIVFI